MEETLVKIPLTLEQRMAYGEVMRLPASWEEFLEVLPHCEYPIAFDEDKIISFRGYASENHEMLVAEIIRLIGNLLVESEFRVSGSNLALHIPGEAKRYFNADCAVIKGASENVTLKPGIKVLANPILLVEVLSPSTLDFDFGHKFRHYRNIPSLRQVLFISSTQLEVVSAVRLEQDNKWLLQTFKQLQDTITILDQGEILLETLYHKVDLGAV